MNSNIMDSNVIYDFKNKGISALKKLTEKELNFIIRAANEAYYSEDTCEPLMSYNEYDILISYTSERFPKSIAIKEGHTQIGAGVEKNKVTLPYHCRCCTLQRHFCTPNTSSGTSICISCLTAT